MSNNVEQNMTEEISRKTTIGVVVSSDLRATLEEIADREERSLSQTCALILRRYVEQSSPESDKTPAKISSVEVPDDIVF